MIVALTGKIASGKSTVGSIFSQLGANVIDADKIGHRLLKTAKVKKELLREFGRGIFSGSSVDRAKLAEEAFSSRIRLSTLNSIMHPLIQDEIRKLLKPEKINVVEIPLPSSLDIRPDKVIYVYAPKVERAKRLLKKGFASRDISRRMQYEEKPPSHDFVINNVGSLDSLRKQVEVIWRHINAAKKSNIPGKLRPGHKRAHRHNSARLKAVRQADSRSVVKPRKKAPFHTKRKSGNAPARNTGPEKRRG